MEQNKVNWTIDPGHSNLQFKVKHLGIASIVGTFTKFEGTAIAQNEDFTDAEIDLSIYAESLTTNNKQRDEHLKGEMFFDVVTYPKIIFAGSLKKTEKGYTVKGALTVRGTTNDIQLATSLPQIGLGRWDDTRAGFELSGKINRKDFGITLEILTGTGSLVVGEDIYLFMDVELIRG